MNKKTKTIIVVTMILIVSALVGKYYFEISKNNEVILEDSQIQNENPQKNDKSESMVEKKSENKNYQQTEPNMKTIAITGSVTQISNDSIEVLNDGVRNIFPITENVFVVSIKAKDSGVKKISDIKKDDNVSVVINTDNSQTVGIQIN